MAAIQAADAAGRDGPWRWLLLAASLSATLLLNFYRDGQKKKQVLVGQKVECDNKNKTQQIEWKLNYV